MPDREKVIKGLECCIIRHPDDKARCDACPYESACGNRLKMDALALLKAQEPKRVSVVNNGFTGLPVTHCPKCHRPIDMFFGAQGVSTIFCPWCGQAVKWE